MARLGWGCVAPSEENRENENESIGTKSSSLAWRGRVEMRTSAACRVGNVQHQPRRLLREGNPRINFNGSLQVVQNE